MVPGTGPHAPIWSDADRRTRGARFRRARLRWAAMSALVVLCGVLATGVVASAQLESSRNERVRAYNETSEDLASAVQLELQRQTDLLVSTGAYVAEHPTISGDHLRRWIQSIRALDRYPELLGVLFVRVVDHHAVDAYVGEMRAAGTELAGPDGSFEVQPPGPRDWYCLIQAVGYQADTEIHAVPGFDYCVDPMLGGRIEPVRLSGRVTFLSGIELAGTMPLLAISPVYRGGVDPGTAEARVANTLGGAVTVIDIDSMLERLFADRDGVGAVLAYGDEWSNVEFVAGDPRATNGTFEADLSEGWTLAVRVTGPVEQGTVTSLSWLVLAAGVSASLTLAALLFVLGTSRARALDLVDAATEELRHLALHDPLTGLPNRMLLTDRLERIVRRSERDHTHPAALFVDLDGFKAVNDTLGHSAGDELLRSVGDRLGTTLRGVDTIARMGGDEFVVLFEVDRPDAASDIARRLVEAMRPPFVLSGGHVAEVTASVGVAVGGSDRLDGEWLLREADLALYDAKASGRDQWKVAR